MVRFTFLRISLAYIAAAAGMSLLVQTGEAQTGEAQTGEVQTGMTPLGKHVKVLPAPVQIPSSVPFAVNNPKPDIARSIQIIPADRMTPHDRDLAADAESSIRERAGFESLEFNEGNWSYEQLICTALPDHLLLRFTRNDGAREMSMFSAAIPRNGEGRIRIIPILRKGYSLFSPAPIGALTISAFNHIRAEENTGKTPDWLATGLCYAALAGANPQAGAVQSAAPNDLIAPETIVPTLEIKFDGESVIHFADVSVTPHPLEWSMIFDRKGKLLKATHTRAETGRNQAHAAQTESLDQFPGSRKHR